MLTSDAKRVNAVVLAGARNEGKLKDVSPEAWEALIELNGKPLILHSLEPLLAAKKVDRTVVVGPVEELRPVLKGLKVDIIPPTGDMFDNVIAGYRHLVKSGVTTHLCLVSTADVPLITPDIVDNLIQTCLDRGGEVFYPMTTLETMEAAFPGTKRTYGKLRDATVTGGNLFVVNGQVLENVADQAKALIAARKNPAKMAMVVGLGFVVKLVLGRLTIAELERYIQRRFGFVGRAVIVPWAETGIDVDKPSDMGLVKEYLAKRGK